MTPLQVQVAWGVLIGLFPASSIPHCRMAGIRVGPVRGKALFEHGRLSALFFTAGVKTDRGIGIGSSLKAVVKAYHSRLDYVPAANNANAVHVYTKARYLGDGRALRFDPDPRTNRIRQIGIGGHALGISAGRC